MIRPGQAWCLQIDVTNSCHLDCSNCTRLLGHARKRFFMSLGFFEHAVGVAADWVLNSNRDPRGKVVGIMGGEPLLHPEFPKLVDILTSAIPRVENRGLWTSLDWTKYVHPRYGEAASHVVRLVGPHEGNGRGLGGKQGWLNWNMHTKSMRVHHQPVLAASVDLVPDPRERWTLIRDCWLQTKWSPAITPSGFYFCEVAAAIDTVLGGVGGIPLTDDRVWEGNLFFTEEGGEGIPTPQGPFAQQIQNACSRCGVCIPLPGRLDSEERDDVSPSNIVRLEQIRSPRLAQGRVSVVTERPKAVEGWNPRTYVKGVR